MPVSSIKYSSARLRFGCSDDRAAAIKLFTSPAVKGCFSLLRTAGFGIFSIGETVRISSVTSHLNTVLIQIQLSRTFPDGQACSGASGPSARLLRGRGRGSRRIPAAHGSRIENSPGVSRNHCSFERKIRLTATVSVARRRYSQSNSQSAAARGRAVVGRTVKVAEHSGAGAGWFQIRAGWQSVQVQFEPDSPDSSRQKLPVQ